ncbi:hypothetical protein F0562_019830 [Nyssa sinensis]|uniref:Uncharacterized protein n=1 Tax=Nyssa sinensis TaxID=561372 RepID=A0A5J5BUX0_9ASTE|nr:hypothetical protein F0562_019830 [Nyssa sinensis]
MKELIARLLSDLESRKNFHINFITVRKFPSKADACDKKEGTITGGPAFVKAVGDTILDATGSDYLPGWISGLVQTLFFDSLFYYYFQS